ncbi:MAG: hypothetical protein K8S56_00950, partial [Candidatus Cloacimonetes bacterium]|nr:hypothetical protein [Candidatus Cloacimonadota bacterium]
DVMITAHNYDIYYGTILVVPSLEAYVVLGNVDVVSGSNDIIEFGESAQVSVTLSNLGNQDAVLNSVAISENDPWITVSTTQFDTPGTIPALGDFQLPDDLVLTISPEIPDQHEIVITLTIETDSNSWTRELRLTAFAPEINVTNVLIMDYAEHLLDPGETSDFRVYIQNTGSAAIGNMSATITNTDANITFNNDSDSMDMLYINGEDFLLFNVTASDNAPPGNLTLVEMQISSDNGWQRNLQFVLCVGYFGDDFETNTLTRLPWEDSGSTPWVTTTVNPYEGIYCARAGFISHEQTTVLSLSINLMQGGDISFFRQVSCEQDPDDNFDYLSFSINGTEMERWDGEVSWSEESYPVQPGPHNFT